MLGNTYYREYDPTINNTLKSLEGKKGDLGMIAVNGKNVMSDDQSVSSSSSEKSSSSAEMQDKVKTI